MNNLFLCLLLVSSTFSSIVARADDNPDSEAINALCTRFYNEICLSKLDSPRPIVSEQGYYLLDLESYKTELGKTGLFTDAFIASRDVEFNECKVGLEQEKLTPEQVWEGGIEMNAPMGCPFDYAYYLKAQEDPDGFRLEDLIINDSTASVTMRYYSGDWTWGVYLSINLIKAEDGEWYIDEVTRLEKE